MIETPGAKAVRWTAVRANYKLLKELCDFFFRVVQMWVVLAAIWFVHVTLDSALTFVVSGFLVCVLAGYSLFAPQAIIMEWRETKGHRTYGHGGYIVQAICFVIALSPLMWIDPIIAGINSASQNATAIATQGTTGE